MSLNQPHTLRSVCNSKQWPAGCAPAHNKSFLWPIWCNIEMDFQNVSPEHSNVQHKTIYLQLIFILSSKQTFTLSEIIFIIFILPTKLVQHNHHHHHAVTRGVTEKQREGQKVLKLWVRTQNNLSIHTSAVQDRSDRLMPTVSHISIQAGLPYLAFVVQTACLFSADMERVGFVDELIASGCGGLLHRQTDLCLSDIALLEGGWSSFASQQQQRFKAVTFCRLSEP